MVFNTETQLVEQLQVGAKRERMEWYLTNNISEVSSNILKSTQYNYKVYRYASI